MFKKTYKTIKPPTPSCCLFRSVRLFFLLTLLLSCTLASTAPADEATAPPQAAVPTLKFLPCKIHAAQDPQALATEIDTLLAAQLAHDQVTLLARAEAEKLPIYQAAWPPNIEDMAPLFTALDSRFVATGTITRTGDALSVDLVVYDAREKPAMTYFHGSTESLAELDQVLADLSRRIIAYTDRTSSIAKIAIEGNRRVDSGAILRAIASRHGDRFDRNRLDLDLKQIYKLGYFDDALVDSVQTEDGMVITFKVKEKPLVSEISFSGLDELKEEDLKEAISFSRNSIINSNEVRKSVQNIRQLYKEKGFYDTEVRADLSYPDPGNVEVRFVIKEGEKIYVKEIRITGNQAFTAKELKKLLVVKEKNLFSFITDAGLIKPGMLEHDSAKLTTYYHNNGYIEAKVGKPEVSQEEQWLYISFQVDEGPRYRVGTVTVSGDLLDDPEKLQELLQIRKAEFVSRETIRDDVMRLTDFYSERGYAFAEIDPDFESGAAENVINLRFNIRQNSLVYINRITIKGNTDTRDKVIRRQLSVEEKGLFNTTALKASTSRIRRLGFFEDVTITPEPTLEHDRMDITVQVKEQPTGTFSIGAGYSSAENLLLQGEISKNNFLGLGQTLSLQAKVSGSTTRYNLSFTEPAFYDTRLLVGMDVFDWKREYDDYTKDSQGFNIRFGYPIWERWTMFWSYGYDSTKLDDVAEDASDEILESEGITNDLSLGFTRDTRDKGYDASTGSRYSVRLKYAGKPLGGDFAFSSIEADSNWYFPGDTFLLHQFFAPSTFHFKLAGGYVQKNSGGRLPVYEKFYLGGINTIRGFDSGQISPKDQATGERIGGDKMWYTNIEYIFPLISDAGLKGVVFFDAGNVYAVDKGWDFGFVKGSVGFGFRWLSPMGPLRLEWGHNLKPAKDEDTSNWDFSIGGSF